MSKNKILIVEDNTVLLERLRNWLEQDGYEVFTAIEEPPARKIIREKEPGLVLSDVRLPKGDGLELLEWMNGNNINIPFVVMTGYSNVADAVKAMKLGAIDYLVKQCGIENIRQITNDLLRKSQRRTPQGNKFRRKSKAMQEVYDTARLAAPSDIRMLLLGENGTGKELLAHYIHAHSERKDKPFVPVNCGGISETLAQSELFGHVKGAFTGADGNRNGCFYEADGGTLFMDEVGNMPMSIQATLLRVLEDGCYSPAGSNKRIKSDVRVIAATNEDLELAIREGRFREDLFHRLNELSVTVPPLRECPEDILPLAERFKERFSEELQAGIVAFDEEAKEVLLRYHWSGNVRELRNCIKRAVLYAKESGTITVENLHLGFDKQNAVDTDSSTSTFNVKDKDVRKRNTILALESCNWNKEKAAEKLGITRSTIYRWIDEFGIRKPE